jgi:hypothetical protein
VNTDDPNTLSIELLHISSGNVTRITVGFLMWALMGLKKPELLEEQQQIEIHHMLLDYCLMQTGQASTALRIFQTVPTMNSLYEAIGAVEPKLHRAYRRASGSAELDRIVTREPKNMREHFSEGLRMVFVPKGTAIYEQNMLGLQMFFIRTGKVSWIVGSKCNN